jgi:predicted  nucleic acid-binding Zn-ribbon protein
MKRTIPWAAVALALTGCDKPQSPAPPVAAETAQPLSGTDRSRDDLAQSRADQDALAAELTRTKQALALAQAGAAVVPEDIGKLRAERDALAAEISRLQKSLEAAAASSRGAGAAADPARSAEAKGRSGSADEAARARAAADDLMKRVEDLRRTERDLLDKLAASRSEAERLRSSTTSLERQARDAQNRADAASSALRDRLGFAGTESIPAHRVLPVAWSAAAGDTIRWSWRIEEAPESLVADVLEFAIVAPDGTKSYGARAGHDKTSDTGSLVATVGGRWTAVWQNRHPEEPFTVRFTVTLEPSMAPRPVTGD